MQNNNIKRLLERTDFKPLKIVTISTGVSRLFEYSILKTNTGEMLKKKMHTEGDRIDCLNTIRSLENDNPLYLHVN
jgi:hypothetical protein